MKITDHARFQNVTQGLVILAVVLLQTTPILAFWPIHVAPKATSVKIENFVSRKSESLNPSPHMTSPLPDQYELALKELHELESEPLCHRIAARLLVNSCHLLEGKDEATVFTDSGRKIRDFVDSYAASLAICDLERGSFSIPKDCVKFQEQSLSLLPLQEASPDLHVTSREIDQCLSGLATSDSAWNTWISYRHKALRFCEAARVDHEKAQHILLFQRLTEIMRRLTESVDQKIESRMRDVDRQAQVAMSELDDLMPRLGQLRGNLGNLEDFLSDGLAAALQTSTNSANHGIESAAKLQRLLQSMLTTVLENHGEVVSIHEQGIQTMAHKAEDEMETMVTMISAAAMSAASLQHQIEFSQRQIYNLETKQDILEEGMQRLVDVTENLSVRHQDHSQLLWKAHNMTDEILDMLGEVTTSTYAMGELVTEKSLNAAWLPYFWCPVASLLVGSYGLPPSVSRNFLLVALGEVFAYILSNYRSLYSDTQLLFARRATSLAYPWERFNSTAEEINSGSDNIDSL